LTSIYFAAASAGYVEVDWEKVKDDTIAKVDTVRISISTRH
jgi:hypothetical protein